MIQSLPPVAIVMAVLNEAATVDAKLHELGTLDYPRHLVRMIIVDGGSTDGTCELLLQAAAKDAHLEVLLTRLRDKPAQLNEALARVHEPWVLFTDADARLPRETLRRLVDAGESDPRVGVVGVPVMPAEPHPLDDIHWRLSNRLRRVEALLGTTGLVVACCYLVRRPLLDRFPVDTEADDVHVTHLAAVAGARVALVETTVSEIRSAATGVEWYRHKVRRARGYLREVFRFLPATLQMSPVGALLFLGRTAALTLGPVAGIVAAITIFFEDGGWTCVAAAVFAFAAARARHTHGTRHVIERLCIAIALPLWTAAIATSALVSYPFVRHSACYRKVTLRTATPR